MVFENEPRGFKGAESPDWRLRRPDNATPGSQFPGGTPPQNQYAQGQYPQSQYPQGKHSRGQQWPGAPMPPYAQPQFQPRPGTYAQGFGDPAFGLPPKHSGSTVGRVISIVVLALISFMTLVTVLVVFDELTTKYAKFEGEVISAEYGIGCDLTLRLDSGEESIVSTGGDCADSPKTGERISAYLPVDSDGKALSDKGKDDLSDGYLPGEKPASAIWALVMMIVVVWLAARRSGIWSYIAPAGRRPPRDTVSDAY